MADNVVCANFLPEIIAGTSNTCIITSVTGTGGCDDPFVISTGLNISATAGNVITCEADGIFAAPETLCYRLAFHETGELCVTPSVADITFEFVPSGSSLELSPPYLSQASLSAVQIRLVTSTGTVLSTASFPAGSQVGTWNATSIAITADTLIGVRVTNPGVGTIAHGLSVSALICEPTSNFIGVGSGGGAGTTLEAIGVNGANCITMSLTGTGSQLNPRVINSSIQIDPVGGLECGVNGLRMSTPNLLAPIVAPPLAGLVAESSTPLTDQISIVGVLKEPGRALELTEDSLILRFDPAESNSLTIGKDGGLYSSPEHHTVAVENQDSAAITGISPIDLDSIGIYYSNEIENLISIKNPSDYRPMSVQVSGSGSFIGNELVNSEKFIITSEVKFKPSDLWQTWETLVGAKLISFNSRIVELNPSELMSMTIRYRVEVIQSSTYGNSPTLDLFAPSVSALGSTK